MPIQIRHPRRARIALSFAASLSSLSLAATATPTWANPLGGDFQTPANWSPAQPPAPADPATFVLPSSYTVTLSADTTIAQLSVAAGDLTLDLNAHTYSLRSTTLDAGTESLLVGGALAFTNPSAIPIPPPAPNVRSNVTRIGLVLPGSLTLTGPAVRWSNADRVSIGYGSAGSLTVDAGASATADTVSVGLYAPGALALDGPASSLTSDLLAVGDSAPGSLSVTRGATLTTSTNAVLGSNATPTSPYATIDGPGSAWNARYLYVGNGTTASLAISSGATVASTSAYLGRFAGSSGTVTLVGRGSALTCSGILFAGYSGAANLSLSHGAAASDYAAYVAYDPGSAADVSLAGPGTTWTHANSLTVGLAGAATLSLADGATLTSPGASLAGNPGSSADVSLSDPDGPLNGLTTWTSSAPLYVGGSATGPGGRAILLLQGGLLSSSGPLTLFNTPGSSLTLANTAALSVPTLTARGSLNLIGGSLITHFLDVSLCPSLSSAPANSVEIAPGGSIFAGPNQTLASSLLLHNASVYAPSLLTLSGPVTGSASFTGPVSLAFSVSPGDPTAPTSSFSFQSATFQPSATLLLDIASATAFDRLSFSTQSTLAGTLSLTLLNDFTPSPGQSFPLLAGPLAGSFSILELPSLPPGLSWDTSSLYTTGTIAVLPEPTPLLAACGLVLLLPPMSRHRR